MARYKHYDLKQSKMLPIDFDRQILPGTFEYTLSYLIDHKIDLEIFEDRYRNDDGGAPAYAPAILLKIILFAYSKGIVHSRQIEGLCRENVVCMALSADAAPHFTTIAEFVSSTGEAITRIFRDVLLVCEEAGLIGKEMFAVDGVKLPGNAAKEWSGTKEKMRKKGKKMQKLAEQLIAAHRRADQSSDAQVSASQVKQLHTLNYAIEKVERFLSSHDEKLGKSGKPKQSNITDNDSAKMPTSKGVVQGYTGVAMLDAKHQVIVHAEAHGEGQEHGLLQPMIEGVNETFKALDLSKEILKETKLSADAGYSSEANAKYLFEKGMDAYVADTQFRKRDPRFKNAEEYKPTRPDEPFAKVKKPPTHFPNTDFQVSEDHSHCVCPAGNPLIRDTVPRTIGDFDFIKFRGSKYLCGACPLRVTCLKYPTRTPFRQVAFVLGRTRNKPEKYLEKMKRKLDSEEGRYQYSRRLGIVEPVFGNIRHTHRLNRFTLRSRRKVNGQWLIYCLVHNIGKVQRYGATAMMKNTKKRAKIA